MDGFYFTFHPTHDGICWAEIEGHCTVISDRQGDPDALEIDLLECGGDGKTSAEGFVLIHELRAHLWKNYADKIALCARDAHLGRMTYDYEIARAS